jgi:ABC-2 type transport system permease protein
MKQILTVFRFTFVEAARKKSFIIMTCIVLVLILLSCMLPMLSGQIASAFDSDQSKTCYLLIDSDRIPGAKATLQALYPGVEFFDGDKNLSGTYKDEIKVDGDTAMIEIVETDGIPYLRVTTKDFMSFLDAAQVADSLSPIYIREVMREQGVAEEWIDFSQTTIPYEVRIAGSMDLSGYIVGIALLMIMFFAIYYYGYGVSMSIANEKASRVMETLIVSAKPSHILIGKCLGMGALGLAQLSSFLLVAAVGYQLFVPRDFMLMGMPLSLSAFTLSSALLVLIYFILGYSLYAVMNAVCGALVDKIEDLNSAMMPVMFISMISFYVGYFTAIFDPGGIVSKIAIYVPFTSPFVVPFKLLNSDIGAADIAISIAILAIAVVVVAWLSARLYTASVLRYGKKLKIQELFRSKN